MLYMSSQSTSDGNLVINITFRLGTDLDTAQVLVQNRVQIAVPTLPQDVQRIGVTTKKQSPDITMVVHLLSPDGSLDSLFTSNYALLQVRDELARLDGVGDINVFGAREYSMRIWLDPNKVASRGLTAQDVVQAIQEQNVQVAAGIVGAQPAPPGAAAFQYTVNTQGRLEDEKEFGAIVIKTGEDGKVTRVRDVARVELAARDYTANSPTRRQTSHSNRHIPTPRFERSRDVRRGAREDGGAENAIPRRSRLPDTIRPHGLRSRVDPRGGEDALRGDRPRCDRRPRLPADLAGIDHPAASRSRFAHRHLRRDGAFGFSLNNLSLFGLVLAIGIVVDDAIVVVENIEHHIANGLSPRDAARKAMDEVSGAVVAVALVLGAVFVPTAFMTGITGQFFRQFALTDRRVDCDLCAELADSLSCTRRDSAKAARCKEGLVSKTSRWTARLVLQRLQPHLYLGIECLRRNGRKSHSTRGDRPPRLRRFAWPDALGFKAVPGGFLPTQDRGYGIGFCQLPDAASLDRTQAVVDKMAKIARETPGVLNTMEIAGFNLFGGNQPNTGAVFVPFKEFSERKSKEETWRASSTR
jgi:hypothetical protein